MMLRAVSFLSYTVKKMLIFNIFIISAIIIFCIFMINCTVGISISWFYSENVDLFKKKEYVRVCMSVCDVCFSVLLCAGCIVVCLKVYVLSNVVTPQ